MTKHQTVDSLSESNSISGQRLESCHHQQQQQHFQLADKEDEEVRRKDLYDDDKDEENKLDIDETNNTIDPPIAIVGKVGSSSSDITSDNRSSSSNNNNSIGGLHPFVHWAQSQTHITLRVDLIQVENLNVTIENNGLLLKFSARGRGAHGLQDYYFELAFHSKVDEKFDCHAIERYVLILIKKAQQKSWHRLTEAATRLPWLRVDFDRYAGSDEDSDTLDDYDHENNQVDEIPREHDGEIDKSHEEYLKLVKELEGEKEKVLQSSGVRKHTPREENSSTPITNSSWSKSLNHIFADSSKTNSDIFNPFNKQRTSSKNKNSSNMKYDYRKDHTATVDNSKNTAKHALDVKKTYLFLYNLVMFIMFLKVCIVLLIKGLSGTIDDDTIQGTAFIIKMLTYTQLLETVHPILGLVPGGAMMPFTQVIGRIIVNIFVSEPQVRIGAFPFAHYLFIVWSSIEIFRYSFYALRVFKVNFYPLTWCRYSLFLPLYPMGGFCESMVLFSTIKHYGKTGTYSFSLPNSANISFNLPIMLKIYIFIILGPTIIHLMRYMWSQRRKQLITDKEKIA